MVMVLVRNFTVTVATILAMVMSAYADAPPEKCTPIIIEHAAPPERKLLSEVYESTINCGSVTTNVVAQSKSEVEDGRKVLAESNYVWLEFARTIVGVFGHIWWPCVALYFLKRFKKEISELISGIALLEWGDKKLKIDRKVRPIDQKRDVRRSVDEINEVLGIVPGENPINITPDVRATAMSRYMLSEGLVMRALQAEYGVPIKRNVTAGSDDGFDGFFTFGNSTYVIEVKYFKNLSNRMVERGSLLRLSASIKDYGWKDAHIIFAQVFEGSVPAIDSQGLARLINEIETPFSIRRYSLKELEAQFGIGEA